jgi:hypothetical protein
MGILMEYVIQIILVGLGATLIMDLWAVLLKSVFGIPSLNYAMVGRWVGYFPKGRISHENIAQTSPISGEKVLGWCVHYLIGIIFSVLLFAIVGQGWIESPSLLPALFLGAVTVVLPFFIMQPNMGMGVAASKLPNSNALRLRSFMAHLSFGFGLYISARLIQLGS